MEKVAESKIPLVHTLEEIYDTNPKQLEEEHIPKYMVITRRFEEIYGVKPDFFSRAPSKVQFIGDHLEHSNYPALAAALEQDIVIAFKESAEPYIEINNFIENLYRHIKIPVSGSMKPLEAGQDKWANIIIEGFKHSMEELGIKTEKGVKMLIFSNLLEDAGIGLEAALIVAVEALVFKIYGSDDIPRRKCVMGNDTMPVLYATKKSIMKYELGQDKIEYMKFPEKY